jgi:hypothetical protein
VWQNSNDFICFMKCNSGPLKEVLFSFFFAKTLFGHTTFYSAHIHSSDLGDGGYRMNFFY